MISNELLNYSFYKLFKNLYTNYKSFKYNKNNKYIFKQKTILYINVPKIKYNYEFRK